MSNDMSDNNLWPPELVIQTDCHVMGHADLLLFWNRYRHNSNRSDEDWPGAAKNRSYIRRDAELDMGERCEADQRVLAATCAG